MSIFTSIRDYFCPPKLRNRAGGMAWVKPHGQEYGAEVLSGRVVRTVRVIPGSVNHWEIDPPQQYVATADMLDPRGTFIACGETCRVVGLSDGVLEPIRNPGIGEQDESLRYLPKVPASEPGKVAA